MDFEKISPSGSILGSGWEIFHPISASPHINIITNTTYEININVIWGNLKTITKTLVTRHNIQKKLRLFNFN